MDIVYVTFDEKRFLDLNEAVEHQKKLGSKYYLKKGKK